MELKELRNKRNELERINIDKKSSLMMLKCKIADLTSELKSLVDEESKLEKSLSGIKTDLSCIETQISRIKQEQEAEMNAYWGYYYEQVKRIIECLNSDNIDAFFEEDKKDLNLFGELEEIIRLKALGSIELTESVLAQLTKYNSQKYTKYGISAMKSNTYISIVFTDESKQGDYEFLLKETEETYGLSNCISAILFTLLRALDGDMDIENFYPYSELVSKDEFDIVEMTEKLRYRVGTPTSQVYTFNTHNSLIYAFIAPETITEAMSYIYDLRDVFGYRIIVNCK